MLMMKLKYKLNLSYLHNTNIKYTKYTRMNMFHRQSASTITFLAGTVTLNNGGSRHPAKEIKMHDRYDPNTIENDIAVVRVS